MQELTGRNIGTMSALIKFSKALPISHATLHFKAALQSGDVKLVINYNSILDKYYDLIKVNLEDYNMTDKEFQKYKFQPKLLSYDLYGTTELWSLLLKINNLFSASQFTKQNIKIPNDTIFSILNEILILETPEIKANKFYVQSQ